MKDNSNKKISAAEKKRLASLDRKIERLQGKVAKAHAEYEALITIFYHSQSSYEDLVVNLVKALGKDPTIEMIGTEKIVFQELKAPVLMMD